MQAAYQQEAKGMESVKTLSVCNKPTNLHEPAWNPFPATPYIVPSRKFTAITLARNNCCTNASNTSTIKT